MRRLPLQVVFVATLLGELGRAGSEEDFANNLFSDLGPLLALFGERVTMQFMSESMGWADSIILAMAPIGILTIIVAAIRVSGPLWLKAVIGRARENVSVAEMELMSSTSEEVCELYNGQSIVRCQGKPEIWEFVLLFKKSNGMQRNPPPRLKFKTLGQAFQDGSMASTRYMTGWRWSKLWLKLPAVFGADGQYLRQRLSWSDTEASSGSSANLSLDPRTSYPWEIQVIRDMTTAAPNIALNGHNTISRAQMHSTACFAILVQTGLLVFFGIITYYPDIKQNYLKDNQPVEKSAFPLVASGTALLVVGLLLCAHVVEDSTEEYRYGPYCDGDTAQMIWIQRGQTVGEQIFKPYATLPRSQRTTITASRRRVRWQRDDTVARVDTSGQSQESAANEISAFVGKRKLISIRSWVAEHAAEVKTVIGVSLSLTGFIVQFVGLRKMSWAASVGQLSGVLIMLGARIWVRRRMSQPLAHRELIPDFELEWLALILGGLSSDPHPCLDLLQGSPARKQAAESLGSYILDDKHLMPWTIAADPDQHCRPLISQPLREVSPGYLEPDDSNESNAQSVLEIHINLRRLSSCRSQYFDLAMRVANCMEAALKLLGAHQFHNEIHLIWPVRAQYGFEESPQWISFQINHNRLSNSWEASVNEIASALSLWIYSEEILKQEASREGVKSEFDNPNKNADAGFRETEPGTRRAIPQQQLIQDLRWWVPGDLNSIIHSLKAKEVEHQEGKSPTQACGNRGVGLPSFGTQNADSHGYHFLEQAFRRSKEYMDGSMQEICLSDEDLVTFNEALLEDDRHMKVRVDACRMPPMEADDDVEVIYAKRLLCSFLRTVAKTLDEPMAGQVETQTTQGENVVLRHETIAELVQKIQENRLGTSLEAYLSIIWSLSLEEKLPFPQPVFDLAISEAINIRESDGILNAGLAYSRLWRQCKCFSESQRQIYAKGLACLMEYLKDIHMMQQAHTRLEGLDTALQSRRDTIIEFLLREGHRNNQLVSQLSMLYDNRRHPWPEDLCFVDTTSPCDSTTRKSWVQGLGVSDLHCEAMESVLGTRPWDNSDDNFSSPDATGWTPYHYASACGFTLHPKRSHITGEKDLRGWTPLHYACWYGHDANVRAWLNNDTIFYQGFDGASLFHCAVQNGQMKVLDRLLQRQGAMKRQKWYRRGGLKPHVELRVGNMNCLPQSLQDHEGRTPIHWAVLVGNPDAVTKLIDDREIMDREGNTALHVAALCGEIKIANILVCAGADIEAKGESDLSPLHFAAMRGAVNMVRKFAFVAADAMAGVDTKATPGESPLRRATEPGNDGMLDLLIDAGADIEAKGDFGVTPLHLAVVAERIEAVKTLISAKADIEAVYKDEMKLLHMAAITGSAEIVKILISTGADVNVKLCGGHKCQTPLALAKIMHHTEVTELLEAAGAHDDGCQG